MLGFFGFFAYFFNDWQLLKVAEKRQNVRRKRSRSRSDLGGGGDGSGSSRLLARERRDRKLVLESCLGKGTSQYQEEIERIQTMLNYLFVPLFGTSLCKGQDSRSVS